YHWNFNGVPITNGIATRSSFTVTNATLTNRGPYTVTVSNSQAGVVSTQAFVVFSPSIISQPQSQTVSPGSSNATFVVMATGDGTLHYQWQFEGDDIADATHSSYTVPSAHGTNIGNYQVIVTNDFGSVTSAPAALNLLPG